MKVAVVGATGLVGTRMIQVLEERHFPVDELIPVASERSVGKTVVFRGEPVTVVGVDEAIARRPALAIFSAGAAAWRMDPDKKLVVPEINAEVLTADDWIIANPNCSTIQMLLPLAPLHKLFTVKRVVVSTYQSITGTGQKAVVQMAAEREGKDWGTYPAVYPYPIDGNILPHIDCFLDNGYTKEEMKMVNETHKILDPSIAVSATTVRVPVRGGHSESINLEFEKPFELDWIREILAATPGVVVQDDPARNIYPMPLYAEGRDEVFVGRIRRDFSLPNGLNFWCVADNLRKGAATNAVQIAEELLRRGFIG